MPKRVYFAFHYQDVSDFRANVVRKHNLLGGVEGAGYYDCSIWEEAKRTSPLALKRLINAELQHTSVTSVLIGTDTWQRRWVRYEVMKSLERGNRVLGVHINGIRGRDQFTKALGPNPFDNLGLEISSEGQTAKPTEWLNGQWSYYTELAPFSIAQQPESLRGQHFALSHWLSTFDWVADDGYTNFNSWIG
jgi:hypothetical protein